MRRVGLRERREDILHLVGGHADAGVRDADGEFVAIGLREELDGHGDAARFSELDRVAHEVEQNLAQARRVGADDFRQAIPRDDAQFQALARSTVPHERAQIREDPRERSVRDVDLHLTRLDFRDIEDVVDHRQQMLAVSADRVHAVEPLRWREVRDQ